MKEKNRYREEDLRKDEERFRMLVEHVSDWIWEVDRNAVYTYASPRILDILGYLPSEVIGKTPFDLMESNEAKRVEAIFSAHIVDKLPIKSLENVNLHRDGHEVILETSGAPIFDAEGNCIGYRGVDRDITLRKQAERRQQQLLDIIEASPDLISTADIEGKILYQNPATRDILGTAEEAANSKWAREIILNEGIPTAIEKGYWKGETVILDKTGQEIPVSQIIVAHKSENGSVQFLSTIAHDISERKELEEVINHQALYDELTELPNRRFLQKKLTQMIKNHSQDLKLALLFIDLDNFKAINDDFGHKCGDYLLQWIAVRLKESVRKEDFVCRYAGDEFIIVLENISSIEEVRQTAERIVQGFHQAIYFGENSLKVTGSIGISIYPDDGLDEEKLIKKADQAMYRIKKEGKGNYKFF